MSGAKGRWSAGPYKDGRRWVVKYGDSTVRVVKVERRTRWGARRALREFWS